MAKAEFERTVQQSVLDRLIDLDPESSADPPPNFARSVKQYKASLRRDLEWLLNTRRIPEPAPDEFEQVQRSLYHYGLPDITSLSRDSTDARARLVREVEQAIAIFERRLANVQVTPGESDTESGRRELHFQIQAILRMEPTPEQVVFNTVLELPTGEIEVRGDHGA